MYNNVLNIRFKDFVKRVESLLMQGLLSQSGVAASGRGVCASELDLRAVHDDRSEFWYVRNPAGNWIPLSCLRVIHDDREEFGMLDGTPLVTGFLLFLKSNHRIRKVKLKKISIFSSKKF